MTAVFIRFKIFDEICVGMYVEKNITRHMTGHMHRAHHCNLQHYLHPLVNPQLYAIFRRAINAFLSHDFFFWVIEMFIFALLVYDTSLQKNTHNMLTETQT